MSHSSDKAKAKGKRPKHFLDQTAARSLAESIAGVQEEKASIKVEKHHLAQIGQSRPERSPKKSASKVKLKETKALIAAQQSESKKARNQRRKSLKQSTSTPNGNAASAAPPIKKSVSFA